MRRGLLLGLVRRLLDHGRELFASLQARNTATAGTQVARCFGTFDLTLIIARITRGLRIAMALEARLLRNPPAWETARANAARPVALARPRSGRPPPPLPPDDDAALRSTLPSAEDIAARIRHRPAGAVIAELCRDLGIDPTHKLWREVQDAIIRYGGSLPRVLNALLSRMPVFFAEPPAVTEVPPSRAWDRPLAASTGPP
jgi:hypothetical protein